MLHARGAYYQLLFQLKGTIPSEQRIHLHCFEGSQQLLADWIGEFPNTYFGFTGLVQHFNEAKKQALRSFPESRLLVETDSPYFKIGGRRHSSPALVGMVAKMVADVRGCTWKEVLQVTSSNVRSLYHLYCQSILAARGGGASTGNMLRGHKFAQERHYGNSFIGQNILAV